MNWIRIAIGTAALFVLWSVLDFVIHGMLLGPLYAASPGVFRPMEEMPMGLLYLTVLIGALGFTILYEFGAPRTSWKASLGFGLAFGLAAGVGMGFGTYSVMPISLGIAWGWVIGSFVESAAAALVLHWLSRRKRA